MKYLSVFIMLFSLSFGLSAQDQNVMNVVNAVTVNCDQKWGSDSALTVRNYSLYREYYKQKNYKDAMKGWRYVFVNAAAARTTTHLNGISMMRDKIKEHGAESAYVDTLLAIYDIRALCIEKTGDLLTRKAVEYYRYRKADEDIPNNYNIFAEAANLAGTEASATFLLPWVITAVKADKKAKIITADQVLEIYEIAAEIAAHNYEQVKTARAAAQGNEKTLEKLRKKGTVLKHKHIERFFLVSHFNNI